MKPSRSPFRRRFSIAAFELDARPKENPLARQGRALGGAGSFGVSLLVCRFWGVAFGVSKPHQKPSRRARPRQWQRRNSVVGPRKGGRMAPSRFRFPWAMAPVWAARRGRPVPLVRGANRNGQFALQLSPSRRVFALRSPSPVVPYEARTPYPPAIPRPFATLQPRRGPCHGIPKMSNRHRHLDLWSAHHQSPPTTSHHRPPTTDHRPTTITPSDNTRIPPSTTKVHSATIRSPNHPS